MSLFNMTIKIPQNTYAFIRTALKYNFLQQSADNEMSLKAIEDVRIV